METLFRESCYFCKNTKVFNDGSEATYHTKIFESDGRPILMYPITKQEAKNCLKELGWVYQQRVVFCKECFDLLSNGKFVVDKYNEFCSNDGDHDMPFPPLVMNEPEAKAFINQFKGEKLRIVKALPTAIKYFRGEWKVDIKGLIRENPKAEFVINFEPGKSLGN